MVTQHVQSVDPLYQPKSFVDHAADTNPSEAPLTQVQAVRNSGRRNGKVVRQARKAGATGTGELGNGTILTESVLVINQKPRRFEQRPEYTIYDRDGRELGVVRETGYNFLLHKFSLQTERSRKRTLEVLDNGGNLIYRLDRPGKMIKPKVMLVSADGEVIGSFGRNRLFSRGIDFEVGEETIGRVILKDFHSFRAEVQDSSGVTIASIRRTWAGRRAERTTRADNYVVEISQPGLPPRIQAFVTMAAVVIDILYQQDEPNKDDAKQERQARRLYSAW